MNQPSIMNPINVVDTRPGNSSGRDTDEKKIWDNLLGLVTAHLRASTNVECYTRAMELQMLARSEVHRRSPNLSDSMKLVAVGQPFLESPEGSGGGESFLSISPIKSSRKGRYPSKLASPPPVEKHLTPTKDAATMPPCIPRLSPFAEIQNSPTKFQVAAKLLAYPSKEPRFVSAELHRLPSPLPPLPDDLPVDEVQTSPTTFKQAEEGAGTLMAMRFDDHVTPGCDWQHEATVSKMPVDKVCDEGKDKRSKGKRRSKRVKAEPAKTKVPKLPKHTKGKPKKAVPKPGRKITSLILLPGLQ